MPIARPIPRAALLTLLLYFPLVAAVNLAQSQSPPSAATPPPPPETASWSVVELEERIRGAWAGKMIGVVAGTPFEFRHCGRTVEGPIHHDLPTSVALLQDDIYVNLVFLEALEREGIEAPMSAFAAALRDSRFGLYHANLAARRNLLLGIEPPLSGQPPFNLHADDIDFQIEADFIGLVAPGLPRTASEIAFRVGPVMNSGDGVYGGVFVANLYALAFVESDPRRLVERALEALPAESAYRLCVETALAAHAKNPDGDWREAWKRVQEEWDGQDWCPGGLGSPFNIDAKINGAYVAIALLYGAGGWEKTLEIGVRCGQDADCNPSTALGILGAMRGYAALPPDWRARIEPLRQKPFAHVKFNLDSAVEASRRLALDAIRRAGGAVDGDRASVILQAPAPPPKLEQWRREIVPVAEIPFSPLYWKITGAWEPGVSRGERFAVTSDAGNAGGEIEFQGAGVMLIGSWMQKGGRLDVRLDGGPAQTVETFLFARGEMPKVFPRETLWYSGLLPSGAHRLTFRLRDDTHPESEGREVGVRSIIVFERPERIPAQR